MQPAQIITVQLGQCGNQVGGEMYNTFMKEAVGGKEDYHQAIMDSFFRSEEKNNVVARSILIDMEPKVIMHTMHEAKKSGTWEYDSKCHYAKQSGSGNNWAFGYNVHGPATHDPIMDIVSKEVEKCDHLGGFFMLQSLAGGTGSGLGTYITEALRDEYPHTFLVNQVVWPYYTGEVIVQNYNSVLTLSHLYQVSDGILSIENDTVHDVCMKLLNIKKVSFWDMNKVIAQCLSSILLPSVKESGNGLSLFYDIINHLCSHPCYKLFNVKTIPQMPASSIPFSSYIWSGLLKHLHQMLIADAKLEEGINWSIKVEDPSSPIRQAASRPIINRSLSNLLILRGEGVHTANIQPFTNPILYTPWSMNPFMVCSHEKKFSNYDKMAVLLSNSQSIIKPLDTLLEQAHRMFLAGGYIHQYEKHGITHEDFMQSFVQLEQVVQNYKQL